MSKILIMGPCVGEHSVEWVVDQAGAISEQLAGASMIYDWIFKCSFDKANRTRGDSYRGLGLDATLEAFERVKKLFKCRVTTDVHEVWQANEVKSVVDVVQIPAMLCRQTDLIRAAARNSRIVNIKCGTNAEPETMAEAVAKVKATRKEPEPATPWLTYRGTAFGEELVLDPMRLWKLDSYAPVVVDITHTARNDRRMTRVAACVAAALNVDGLFIECHENPEAALSDGAMQLRTSRLSELLGGLTWSI